MGEKNLAGADSPNITTYHDYRIFLRDLLAYYKKEFKVSARSLSKQIGVSHGYFSLVIKGQRNLSLKTLEKLIPHFDLDEKEQSYFKNLVLISDSRSVKVRNQAIKDLKLNSHYKDNHPKEFETYKYLEKWYYVAIRELSLTKNFVSDPRWIKSQLPFSIRIAEVEKALNFLVQFDFLKLSPDGKLQPTERSIQCIGGVFRLSLGNFHGEMLELAKTAIQEYSPEQRKQIGYTMALPRNQLDEAKAILEEAREKLKALEAKHQSSSDSVYHINLSAFPLAGKGCFE